MRTKAPRYLPVPEVLPALPGSEFNGKRSGAFVSA